MLLSLAGDLAQPTEVGDFSKTNCVILHSATVFGLVFDEIVADDTVFEGFILAKLSAFVAAAGENRPYDEDYRARNPEDDVLADVKDEQNEEESSLRTLFALN